MIENLPGFADVALAAAGAVPAAGVYAARHRIVEPLRARPGGVTIGREIETRGGPRSRPRSRRDARRMGGIALSIERARVRTFGKPIRFDLLDRMAHMQVVAPTVQGKTTALLNMIVQDLEEGLTTFILETGGDLGRKAIGYANAYGRPVFVFDPTDEDAWKWNPLAGDPEKVAERAAATLEAVGSSSEDFFKVANATMLRAVVLAAHAWAAKHGKVATLMTVRKIADNEAFRKDALGITDENTSGKGKSRVTINNPHLTDEAHAFWQDRFYGSMSDQERNQFVAGMKGALDMILGNSKVRKAVCPDEEAQGEKELPLAEALESGGLIVMRMPLGEVGVKTARALSVWAMQAFQQVVLLRDPDNAYPVIAYFDEVHNTLGRNMEAAAGEFSSWITMARHFWVGCVFAYQGYDMIPYDLKVVFDGNLRNKLIFGGLSHEDGEAAQKTLGDDLDHVKSTRSDRGFFFSRGSSSESTSEEDRYRWSVDEIRSLPRGQMIYSGTASGQLLYPTLIQVTMPPTVEEVREKVQAQKKRAASARHRRTTGKKARRRAASPNGGKS